MGCGKTTIGRKLAVRLGYYFIDTDHQIQREQNANVKDLFANHGEGYFRNLETDLLKRLCKLENTILATGGGILTTPGNLELLKSIGTTIYLKTDLADISERVSRNDRRPMLQTENPLETIQKLFNERESMYSQAECTIETQSLKMWHIVNKIIQNL